MMKNEFDELSRKAGYGACADHMWDEIERTYMGTEISKEGMVKVYWTDPGMYRVLRDAANKRAELEREVMELRRRVKEAEANVERLKAENEWASEKVHEVTAKLSAVRAAVA